MAHACGDVASNQFAVGIFALHIVNHQILRGDHITLHSEDFGDVRDAAAAIAQTHGVDDDVDIEIDESDLRVDTYRASGAGGQHVNKTDSAVRITHEPTGVVVSCQQERSQHKNRAKAMKMLQAALYQRAMEEKEAEKQALEDSKSDIAWGNQIRSYVLQPYTMVKDHRTNLEVGNVTTIGETQQASRVICLKCTDDIRVNKMLGSLGFKCPVCKPVSLFVPLTRTPRDKTTSPSRRLHAATKEISKVLPNLSATVKVLKFSEWCLSIE